jgi:hypothetical protein
MVMIRILQRPVFVSERSLVLLATAKRLRTKNRAIEDELMPAALVCLKDLDVYHTKDEI